MVSLVYRVSNRIGASKWARSEVHRSAIVGGAPESQSAVGIEKAYDLVVRLERTNKSEEKSIEEGGAGCWKRKQREEHLV